MAPGAVGAAPPIEYVNLILMRDVFHCRPSELRQERVQDVREALVCLSVEFDVREAKAHKPGTVTGQGKATFG